jgi:uncharacterized protein
MASSARALVGLISVCVCGIAAQAGGQTPKPAADDTAASHARAAERVLVATNAEKMSRGMTDAIYQSMARSNPAASASMTAVRNVMQKYTSFEAMKPDMIKAYTATYTEAELNQIAALYQTEVGRMIIERTPRILELTQAASAARMQAMQGELQRALQSAVESQLTPEQQARADAPGNTSFAYQVDTPATLAPDSPALRYPAALQGPTAITGEVDAQFVVDTLGAANLQSLRIARSTNSAFADALRQQLPGLRFTPAERRGHKVKQLVQMPFKFAPVQ